MNIFFSLQGQCAYYLPRKEEFIVFGLLMIEVESVDQRNGFCRRNLKITNTKVNCKPIVGILFSNICCELAFRVLALL